MIIYFNICAALLFAMLIFSVCFRGMTNGARQKLFLLLLCSSFLCTIIDIINVATNGCAHPSLRPFAYIFHTLYFILRGATLPLYILYIISLTDTWHKFSKSVLFKLALTLPYTVQLVCLVINPFTDIIFYFDGSGCYHRGWLIFVPYVITAFYMAWCTVYIYKNRCLFSKDKLFALFALFPLNLLAVAIQFFLPNYVVEMFVMAIACLAILSTVQRPEENIDVLTGLGNNNIYMADLKRTVINEKTTEIIFINIGNHSSLQELLGIEADAALNKMIARNVIDCVKSFKIHYRAYATSNSRLRITIGEKYRSYTDAVAQKINDMLKESLTFQGMQLNIVAYVCTLSLPDDTNDLDTIIEFGKKITKTYSYTGEVLRAKDHLRSSRYEIDRHIDAIIDNALANRLFEVYYQPIYNISLKKFTSAEALIRLKDEKFGFISPDIFIPAAERNGMINKIGDYVLEEVCRFISSQDFDGLGIEYIEVNLSVAQCMQSDLAEKTLEIMSEYGVTADKINLEITETATTHAQNIMEANIKKLINAGITFSLDDYGTGYSNMKSVASLPLDIIKLDKSLINDKKDQRMQSVLKNTVTMLKEMNLKILIEGIETEDMLNEFIKLKCDYVQGYYFSRPVPQAEFVNFIKASL